MKKVSECMNVMNKPTAHPVAAGFLIAVLLVFVAACGGGSGSPAALAPPPSIPPPPPPDPGSGNDPGSGGNPGSGSNPPPPPAMPSPLGTGPADCVDGKAEEFACMGIALENRVGLYTMEGGSGNDIWGWADPDTGREYALMGLTNGAAFVDVTNPQGPVYLGRLPTETRDSVWRDIKVYRDHAYIVADGAGAHGMQVFDLKRLRNASGTQKFSEDVLYDGFENSHNLAINEATGFAYAVATNTCGGGLHMINIKTPNNPLFAGCHDTVHTHDTQCVVYNGPDTEHRGREICVSSNEDHVEIVDVTDKSAPLTLSSTKYPQLAYVHQGWLTEDHRYFLLGDELDELNFNLSTRTHVFDVSDLAAPSHLYAHALDTQATDHNLYVRGNRVYEANYTSGLRVLEFGDLARQDIREIAFFDTIPATDSSGTIGAWSVYPYLPSGTLIVSDMQNGLFVLKMQ